MAATHISVPPWTGKALGAAAALVFAPPQPGSLLWWLTAGLALGHGFDSLGSHFAPRPATAPLPEDARASLRYTFAALGRIAAAGDGGPQPLALADSLMTRLAFPPPRRREALGWFEAGRDPAFPFDTLARACRDAFAAHPALQGLARRSLCRMAAWIDTPAAMGELLALGARLGWERQRLVDEAMGELDGSETDRAGRARRALGVRGGDTADVVRLAYRRRVARWHPDRLPARASPEERAAAERRMAQLRDALECLLGAP